MADEKARNGRDVPQLNWRYILFKWNDSDEEMAASARRWLQEIGVDRLCWEITDHPEDSFSRRFVAGLADLERDPPRDLGRQQSRQRDPRRDAARADRAAALAAGTAGRGPSRGAAGDSDARAERCRPVRFARRRATAGDWCASARSCSTITAECSIATSRAHGCPATSPPGGSADVPIEIPTPDRSGRYTLKFDLVSEGIDWFEACGSETTSATLVVR